MTSYTFVNEPSGRRSSLVWDRVTKGQTRVLHKLGEDQYQEAFQSVRRQLHQDHFKHERVQGMVDSVSAAANVNKSSNVRQEATGVTDTVDNVMSWFGLEKYSKLTKAGGYQNFLLHELNATVGGSMTSSSLRLWAPRVQ
jgi:virulence-associated protein VapD